MWRDEAAQWKPGDLFAIRSTGNEQDLRFYKEIPEPNDQQRYFPMRNVNRNFIYTVTAVCEESTWTAIKFQNQDTGASIRGGEPAESLWTIARHMDIPIYRHVRRVPAKAKPNFYEYQTHHSHLHTKPVRRCRLPCAWGSMTPNPCKLQCARARGHDGLCDCLQHPEPGGVK